MVGHTHDLVDAFFALVSKALHGVDVLSMVELFQVLEKKLTTPPDWHHLRDIYDFKDAQPDDLSSKRVKGVSKPHHYRISWGRDGVIILECKAWMTSGTWSEPLVLCDVDQVRALRKQAIHTVEPEFDKSYLNSALTWLAKLKGVMSTTGRDISGLDHCVGALTHELPSFSPSGATAVAKVIQMRDHRCADATIGTPMGADVPAMANAKSVYPSLAVSSESLIHIKHGRVGDLQFREEALTDGMFVLYRNSDTVVSSPPVLLGKALRVVSEAQSAFVVVEVWSPLLKEKHEYKPNIFGTWLLGNDSARKDLSGRPVRDKNGARTRCDISCAPWVMCWCGPLLWTTVRPTSQTGAGFISLRCTS